jgi:ABC-type transport system involved in Fe-S cluster assembly fused permease/ATPase subunit
MTKKVLKRLLLIVATVMLFSILYEIRLPFDEPTATGLFGRAARFGMPHIAIQWLIVFSIIGMTIELIVHMHKEHGWFEE